MSGGGGATPFGLLYRLRNGRRPYRRDEVRRLPRGRCGVYALWLPSPAFAGEYDCIYVGKSESCVRRRLLDHLRDDPNPGVRRLLYDFRTAARYSVAFAERHEADALETAAIRAWRPETNRSKRGAPP